MAVPELVEYLQSWQPSGEWMDPPLDGLGCEVAGLVAGEPGRYAGQAQAFYSLDEQTFVILFNELANTTSLR